MEIRADRIIFSVDWLYVDNKPGSEWIETIAVSPEDKKQFLMEMQKIFLSFHNNDFS
tara:strand:- start:2850 stop:3020 length:171 start_codon:yes stop_codon:yes gene_type:complete